MQRVESVKISGKILPEEPSEELRLPIITITDEDESEQTSSTIFDQNDFDIFKEFSNENIIRVKHNKTMKQLPSPSCKHSPRNITKPIKDKTKQEIKQNFLRKISMKIAIDFPLYNDKGDKDIKLLQRKSYFNKAKKIYQKFLCIGIDESGLDTIDDIDEFILMPKITFNYPNNYSEKDLEL